MNEHRNRQSRTSESALWVHCRYLGRFFLSFNFAGFKCEWTGRFYYLLSDEKKVGAVFPNSILDFSLRIRNVEAFSRFWTIKNLPSGVSPYGFQFRRNDALQFSTPNHQNGAYRKVFCLVFYEIKKVFKAQKLPWKVTFQSKLVKCDVARGLESGGSFELPLLNVFAPKFHALHFHSSYTYGLAGKVTHFLGQIRDFLMWYMGLRAPPHTVKTDNVWTIQRSFCSYWRLRHCFECS